jgi:iron complex transport system substrate-binding protein
VRSHARLALFAICALVFAALAPGATAAPARRVVSLAPSVTETLFALGEGPTVVGVSQYCDYPPAAMRLPRVGTFLTPNIEAIVALRPTLIIGPGLASSRREVRALRKMGYPTMRVDEGSLDGIEQSIQLIGERTGQEQEARGLLGSIREQIGMVRARLQKVRPRTVLMLVGHQPMVAVGNGTYLDDLLKLAGADNIADLARQPWPRLSIEYIIAMRPEVILDGQMGNDSTTPDGFWARYPAIPAVRNHRIYSYPQNPVLHPGPRIGQSLEILARIIHPAVFGEAPHAIVGSRDSAER